MAKKTNKRTQSIQRRQKSNPPLVRNTQLAYSKSMKTGAAKTKILSDGAIRVTHREFLSDVLSTTAFAVRKYALNPGDASTFRWLSGMARLYESYVFRRLKVEFIGACSATTAGRILMAVDYDPADSSPVDKIDAASYQGSVSTSPWVSETLTCDPRALTKVKERYVRAQSTSAMTAGDLRSYDSGNLFVMTTGFATLGDNSFVGELYVEYEVDLHTPQRLNAVEDSTFFYITGQGGQSPGNVNGGLDQYGNGRIYDQFGTIKGEGSGNALLDITNPIRRDTGPAITRTYHPETSIGAHNGFTSVIFRNAGRYVVNQVVELARAATAEGALNGLWPDISSTQAADALVSLLTETRGGLNLTTNGVNAARSVAINVLRAGAELIFDDFDPLFKSQTGNPTNSTGISRISSFLQPYVGFGHELVPTFSTSVNKSRSDSGVGSHFERPSRRITEDMDATHIQQDTLQSPFASHAFVKQGVVESNSMFDNKVRFMSC